MDKKQMLSEIEDHLKVANKGALSEKEFPDSKIEELAQFHKYITSQEQISPQEQTMLIDEIGKLKSKG